ncbi:MAG: hypothetical protein ACT4PV_12200 [Planctomycetaceae bacterium]
MRPPHPPRILALGALVALVVVACVAPGGRSGAIHRWWAGYGPVVPHDTFPGNCKLCHVGESWDTLREDFEFDHAARTGVPLHGAHDEARCLRCHNDRGPVAVFQARGCAGCHEDVHRGHLGAQCASCHNETTWEPLGQRAKHDRTRFPLTGSHALLSCHKCHLGARVGNFAPTPTECVACHADDLAATTNPPHIPLGFVDNCQRCHMPTRWEQTRGS